MKLFLIPLVLLLLFKRHASNDVNNFNLELDDEEDGNTFSGKLKDGDEENSNLDQPDTTIEDLLTWELEHPELNKIMNDVLDSMLTTTKPPDYQEFDRYETVTTYEINWGAVAVVIVMKIFVICVYAAIRCDHKPKRRNCTQEERRPEIESQVQSNDKESLLPRS